MTTSIFIAKLFAVAYLAIGLGMLLNPKYYRAMMKDMMKSKGFMYLGGIMALMAGFFLVYYHNIWKESWTVLITVFGYLALIKGVLLLVAPEWFAESFADLLKKPKYFTAIGVFALVVGIFFGYFGFLV